jgi:hypothetical protein
MTNDDRKRLLDSIRDTSDQLTEVARRFDRLRWMAEKDASGAFLNLADTAGKMTLASLSQMGTLLEILFNAALHTGEKP